MTRRRGTRAFRRRTHGRRESRSADGVAARNRKNPRVRPLVGKPGWFPFPRSVRKTRTEMVRRFRREQKKSGNLVPGVITKKEKKNEPCRDGLRARTPVARIRRAADLEPRPGFGRVSTVELTLERRVRGPLGTAGTRAGTPARARARRRARAARCALRAGDRDGRFARPGAPRTGYAPVPW